MNQFPPAFAISFPIPVIFLTIVGLPLESHHLENGFTISSSQAILILPPIEAFWNFGILIRSSILSPAFSSPLNTDVLAYSPSFSSDVPASFSFASDLSRYSAKSPKPFVAPFWRPFPHLETMFMSNVSLIFDINPETVELDVLSIIPSNSFSPLRIVLTALSPLISPF